MYKNHIQQGDVLIIPCKIPDGATRAASRPIMEGEGHHEHVMVAECAEDFELYEKDGTLYMRVLVATPLVHRGKGGGLGEHATQVVEPGDYRIGQVYEWDPWGNEARKVVD